MKDHSYQGKQSMDLLGSVLLATLFSFIGSISIGFAEVIIVSHWESLEGSGVFAGSLGIIDALAVVSISILVMRWRCNAVFFPRFSFDRFSRIHAILGVLFGIVGYFLFGELLEFSSQILPTFDLADDPSSIVRKNSKSPIDLAFLFLSFCVVSPMAEEFVLRGMFYRLLRLRYNILLCATVLTAIFVLFHPIPSWIPHVILGSVALCLGYEYTNGIVFPTVMHMTINILSFMTIVTGQTATN